MEDTLNGCMSKLEYKMGKTMQDMRFDEIVGGVTQINEMLQEMDPTEKVPPILTLYLLFVECCMRIASAPAVLVTRPITASAPRCREASARASPPSFECTGTTHAHSA